MKKYNSKIIIACDFENLKELYLFLKLFKDEKLFLKLGMQLIYKEGFIVINKLRHMGHNVFLDLKLFDIPTTTRNGIISLLKYEPDFISLHINGGSTMLKLCMDAIKNTSVKLLGVSVLTSMDNQDLTQLNISKKVNQQVEDLMIIAKKENLYGVVCSGFEAKIASKLNLVSVVPGIRTNNSNNDQKRVMTPKLAIENGANFLVIGRSITKNKFPYQAYKQIVKDISSKN